MNDPSVAFIGIGQMGFGMALNLRKHLPESTCLRVHDINQDLLNKFEQETNELPGKVVICTTKAQVVENASIVFTSLPQGTHVYSVLISDKDSVINCLKGQDKIIIECSTIDSQTSIKIGQEIAKAQPSWQFSDAPISGGPRVSRDGKLSCMVGCSSPNFYPVIKDLVGNFCDPSKIFYCGKIGAGVTVKAINNYCAFMSVISLSEAFNMGDKAGVDKNVLNNVINASSGASWISQNAHPVDGVLTDKKFAGIAANNNYEPGFPVEGSKYVLSLATAIAENHGAKLFLSSGAQQIFEGASNKYGGKDYRIVYKYLSDLKN